MRAVYHALFAILICACFSACQKDLPEENTPPEVDAGGTLTVVLNPATGDSLTLSGTATDGDGAVVSYLWSQVSGPNKAVILTPGSKSTFVTGLVSGAYGFQLMATDNKGAVGVSSIVVNVTQNNKPSKPNLPPVVFPGRDTTFDLTNVPGDSIRLAGTATDSDGVVVSYLWSQISGPNTATISNPGAASTWVTNVQSGQYVFQLTATDNSGATGVETVAVTVINPQVFTVTFQSRNSVTDLHFIYNYLGGSNDTSAAEIGASAWTHNGTAAYQRGLLKFDLSKLPANAKIQSAKLSLYSNPDPNNGDLIHANSGTNNAMLIQRATASWNMATTWNNQPATETTGQVVVPHTNAAFLDLLNIDVTTMVRKMAQVDNYGFLIKLQNETSYNSRIFCSTKFPDASKWPKLVLQYAK